MFCLSKPTQFCNAHLIHRPLIFFKQVHPSPFASLLPMLTPFPCLPRPAQLSPFLSSLHLPQWTTPAYASSLHPPAYTPFHVYPARGVIKGGRGENGVVQLDSGEKIKTSKKRRLSNPPPPSHKLQFCVVTRGFSRLNMQIKDVCHGLSSSYAVFRNIRKT